MRFFCYSLSLSALIVFGLLAVPLIGQDPLAPPTLPEPDPASELGTPPSDAEPSLPPPGLSPQQQPPAVEPVLPLPGGQPIDPIAPQTTGAPFAPPVLIPSADDMPPLPGAGAPPSAVARVVQVRSSDAKKIAEVLVPFIEQLPGKVTVEFDGTANSLIIHGQREHVEAVTKFISQLQKTIADSQDRDEPDAEIKVFTLRNSDAKACVQMFQSLFPDSQLLLVADERTNSVIARGQSQQLEVLTALLVRLDDEAARSDRIPGTRRDRRSAAMADFTRDLASAQVDGGADSQLQLLAAQYRQQQQRNQPQQLERIRTQLTERVSQAFDRRQQVQQQQLEALRQRLARIEQQVAARQQIKQQIVEHRVNELLDPNLRWPSGVETGGTQSGESQTTRPQGSDAVPDVAGTPRRPSNLPDVGSAQNRSADADSMSGNLAVLQAELQAAEADLQRMRALHDRGVIPESELDAARGRVDVLQAKLGQANDRWEGQLKLLQIDVSEAKLKLEAAQAKYEDLFERKNAGVASISDADVQVQALEVENAKLAVRRAETMLELHSRTK